jgi:hypothetical protein
MKWQFLVYSITIPMIHKIIGGGVGIQLCQACRGGVVAAGLKEEGCGRNDEDEGKVMGMLICGHNLSSY